MTLLLVLIVVLRFLVVLFVCLPWVHLFHWSHPRKSRKSHWPTKSKTDLESGSVSALAATMAAMHIMLRSGFPSTTFVLFRIVIVDVTVNDLQINRILQNAHLIHGETVVLFLFAWNN